MGIVSENTSQLHDTSIQMVEQQNRPACLLACLPTPSELPFALSLPLLNDDMIHESLCLPNPSHLQILDQDVRLAMTLVNT